MSDSYGDPQQNSRRHENTRGGFRGGRSPQNREGGGFRIRLSDNEMKAARSIQEAFNLRSTVAVLGFALRTLGQMLEEGKLNDLITQNQSQGTGIDSSDNNRLNNQRGIKNTRERPNPFARPSKPSPEETQDKVDSVVNQNSIEIETRDANSNEIKPNNSSESEPNQEK